MRATINVKVESPAEFAKSLRSLAAKVEVADLTAGNDFTIGNARVQVATPQIGTLRAWAQENGYEVGGRGVISNAIKEAYEAALKQERREKRLARAARKAEREAAEAELVTA